MNWFYGVTSYIATVTGSEPIEIWNLVFIQYNRLQDGTLESLGKTFVDTGMGLERLSAVMAGSDSNYDSDLFRPLFDTIQNISQAKAYSRSFTDPQDTAYRILADHARMITVCVGDGVFPHASHRLKNVFRRAMRVAKKNFGQSDNTKLLVELSKVVGDILGDAHPEVTKGLQKVKTVIEFEHEQFRKLEEAGTKVMPKLIAEFPSASKVDILDAPKYYEALKFIQNHPDTDEKISGELALKLYDSKGCTLGVIKDLAGIINYDFHERGFHNAMDCLKKGSKTRLLESYFSRRQLFSPTDDSSKYKYVHGSIPDGPSYKFPVTSAKVIGLVKENGEIVKNLSTGETGCIFLDSTSFYSEAGGQIGDTGMIRKLGLKTQLFKVEDCHNVSNSGKDNVVAHVGKALAGISVGDSVDTAVDPGRRFGCMQNHTATHILNQVLHSVLPLTSQRSSQITPDYLKLDFDVFRTELTLETILDIEQRVSQKIVEQVPISIDLIRSKDMDALDRVIMIPGERYPEKVSLVLFEDGSGGEPCCGTHVANTGDIQVKFLHVRPTLVDLTFNSILGLCYYRR